MVKWIVDQYMVDSTPDIDILGVLTKLGIEHRVLSYSLSTDAKNPFDDDCPIVIYGSMPFVKQYNQLGMIPGAYYNLGAMGCTSFMSKIEDKSMLLNEDHVFVTFTNLIHQRDFLFRMFNDVSSMFTAPVITGMPFTVGDASIFIRPNTTTKLFTGLPITLRNFNDEISALKQLSGVIDDTLILVSSKKEIIAEYRFCIVNREVVSGTQYKDFDNIVSRPCHNESARKLATKMAMNPWQPDIAYVCDVAMLGTGEYKIVEINPISSSGLYASDFEAIVISLNSAAIAEFNGDLTQGDF